jgi:hypothetical protein
VSTRNPASAVEIRETLNEAAVRRLGVNASPIQARVRASATVILARLSPTDFASSEDRELFNEIKAALGDASSSDAHPPSGDPDQISAATAEEIASDVLDLR